MAGLDQGEPEIAASQNSLRDQNSLWELSGPDSSKPGCRFSMAGTAHTSMRTIDIPEQCATEHGMANAARWIVDARGNVRIENGEGMKLAEFATDELDGYLSIYPRHTILTITPIE